MVLRVGTQIHLDMDYEKKIKEFSTRMEEMYSDFKAEGMVEEANGIAAVITLYNVFFEV